MIFLKKDKLCQLNSEEARNYVDECSNNLLGSSKEIKNKVKSYFISLLLEEDLYQNFAFEEIVQFFTNEFFLFTDEDKDKILNNIYTKFRIFCQSKNQMVTFILLDFIVKEINFNIKRKYLFLIKKQYTKLNKKEKRCLNIIENGFYS